MRPQTYVSRRTAATTTASAGAWTRNFNTVRHTQKTLGPLAYSVLLGVMVLGIGLIYVAQSTRATNYDYELSAIDSEISDLQAKKEDLAVEKARLTSIAASEGSEVASNMEGAAVGGYATE